MSFKGIESITSGLSERIRVAEQILREAEMEVRSPIDVRKRNCCEKGFLAVVEAINALLESRGYKVPETHGERFKALRDIEGVDERVAKEEISEEYGARLGKAHSLCFYGGVVELAEEELEKSKKLVESAKKILGL